LQERDKLRYHLGSTAQTALCNVATALKLIVESKILALFWETSCSFERSGGRQKGERHLWNEALGEETHPRLAQHFPFLQFEHMRE
jgi:hypothetical protein